MICAKNYEKLSKFVKSYGQKTVGPFFSGHCVLIITECLLFILPYLL